MIKRIRFFECGKIGFASLFESVQLSLENLDSELDLMLLQRSLVPVEMSAEALFCKTRKMACMYSDDVRLQIEFLLKRGFGRRRGEDGAKEQILLFGKFFFQPLNDWLVIEGR